MLVLHLFDVAAIDANVGGGGTHPFQLSAWVCLRLLSRVCGWLFNLRLAQECAMVYSVRRSVDCSHVHLTRCETLCGIVLIRDAYALLCVCVTYVTREQRASCGVRSECSEDPP